MKIKWTEKKPKYRIIGRITRIYYDFFNSHFTANTAGLYVLFLSMPGLLYQILPFVDDTSRRNLPKFVAFKKLIAHKNRVLWLNSWKKYSLIHGRRNIESVFRYSRTARILRIFLRIRPRGGCCHFMKNILFTYPSSRWVNWLFREMMLTFWPEG